MHHVGNSSYMVVKYRNISKLMWMNWKSGDLVHWDNYANAACSEPDQIHSKWTACLHLKYWAVNCGRWTRLPPNCATIPSSSSLMTGNCKYRNFWGYMRGCLLHTSSWLLVNNVATFTYTTIGFTLASFSLTVYVCTCIRRAAGTLAIRLLRFRVPAIAIPGCRYSSHTLVRC